MLPVILIGLLLPNAPTTAEDLIYTSRDFFFHIGTGCPQESVCLDEFQMILTFDIGVTMQDEIKEAAFREADLSFVAKPNSTGTFRPFAVERVESDFDAANRSVDLTFYPELSQGSSPSSVLK